MCPSAISSSELCKLWKLPAQPPGLTCMLPKSQPLPVCMFEQKHMPFQASSIPKPSTSPVPLQNALQLRLGALCHSASLNTTCKKDQAFLLMLNQVLMCSHSLRRPTMLEALFLTYPGYLCVFQTQQGCCQLIAARLLDTVCPAAEPSAYCLWSRQTTQAPKQKGSIGVRVVAGQDGSQLGCPALAAVRFTPSAANWSVHQLRDAAQT